MLSFLSFADREVVRREREALSGVSVLSHRGVSNLPQTNKRRYTVKLSKIFGILALALLVTVAMSNGDAWAAATGCRDVRVQNWDNVAGIPSIAPIQQSGSPGQWVTIAVLTLDEPNDGVTVVDPSSGGSVNCPPPGDNDTFPIQIKQIVVKWVNGLISAGDVSQVVVALDTTANNIYDPGIDTTLLTAAGSGLASPSGITFSTGGDATNFNLANGIGAGTTVYLIAIQLASAPSSSFFGTVAVDFITEDNWFPGVGGPSSSVHPLYRNFPSNITLTGLQFPGGTTINGYSAGTGGFEDTINRLSIPNMGPTVQFATPDPMTNPRINTRPRAGDNQAILAVFYICEGGRGVILQDSLLPFAPPTLASGLPAAYCLPNPFLTDGNSTAVEVLKFRFDGPAAAGLGQLQLWFDDDVDGILFEAAFDRALTGIVSGGTAEFGVPGQDIICPLAANCGIAGGPGLFDASGAGGKPPVIMILTGNLSSNTPSGALRTYVAAGTRDNPVVLVSSNFTSNSETLVGEITVEGVGSASASISPSSFAPGSSSATVSLTNATFMAGAAVTCDSGVTFSGAPVAGQASVTGTLTVPTTATGTVSCQVTNTSAGTLSFIFTVTSPPSRLTVTARTTSLRCTRVGQNKTLKFTATNTGTTDITVLTASENSPNFHIRRTFSSKTVRAGRSKTLSVKVTCDAAGTFTPPFGVSFTTDEAGSPTVGPASAGSLNATALSAEARLSKSGATFTVQGATLAQVQVFSLSGKKVYDSGMVASNALAWNLLNEAGQPVPNGVYLYVVTMQTPDGRIVKSELKKLVVAR